MRKIAVVSATRAEYYLLKPLLKIIEDDKTLQLQLIVTATHLQEQNRQTLQEIENNFKISQKIFMNLNDDSSLGLSNAMARLQIDLGDAFTNLKPDIVIVLGDRYEMLSVTTTALMLKIPIAHIHGGETTQGAIDEAIRHSISKMSHLHFTSTATYKNRVIQLGEKTATVFNVGSLGVESISNLKLLSKNELEKSINFQLGKKNLLITFHPETLSKQAPQEQFLELLNALAKLQNTKLIFTKANADEGGKIINTMIDNYVLQNQKNSVVYTSLGQTRYFSLLQEVDGVVGNSSSGIIEVPSFHIATLNIGKRQKGRTQAPTVINASIKEKEILAAIKKIYTPDFKRLLQKSENPHTGVNTAKNIKNIIKKANLDNILNKEFNDLD